ncbi:sialin isoform X1 [Drosophila mojavensis]|uniref:Uncharacterized protein, isoform A n=1 Tax=Drosophila mojavensis TaxID=7230 RepID=B4KIG0_DROMO|nr:sialin isoform X1 [Drosophila mojavensis]EDW13457.2 uncharacterized protein Dmoj_GI18217, isoform A [Drosophila mojavensis]
MITVGKQPIWQHRCTKACLLPIRIVVATMGFFGLVCAFTNRVSIAHIILELVAHKNRTEPIDRKGSGVCAPEDGVRAERMHQRSNHEWPESLQGFILGCFYIGYFVAHIPGGMLADRFGAKWVLGISMLCSALCTIFTPLIVEIFHEKGLIAVRILMGVAQGSIFPALTVLLSHWVPPRERSTLGAFCYSGVSAGTVVSNLGSGFMIHYLPWGMCLIVFGTATMFWMIAFVLICASTPNEHLFIRPGEKAYLKRHIPVQKDILPTPWRRILFSKALIALAISQMGHDWGFFAIVSYLPKYMSDVLQFSILSNGIMTALPFIALWLSSLLCGFLADWLIHTRRMTLNVERKVFTLISAFLPGVLMVGASYVGCNKSWAVAFFTLSLFTMGPFYAGQKLTPMDMSPTYSGTIMAICNGLGSVVGVACPSIIGIMTTDTTMRQWRSVFWLNFAILAFSGIVFAVWGTADRQAYDPRIPRHRRRKRSHIPLDAFT